MKLLILILIFIGCSTSHKPKDLSINSVQKESSNKISIMDIEDSSIQEEEVKEKKEKPKISLIVHSSLYHSISLLFVLKQLDEKQIKLSSLSCSGFSTLICALYAKEEKLNFVEWKLFDLLKKLQSKKVYSNEWNELLRDFLVKEFKNTKFSDLKLKLFIPSQYAGKILVNQSTLVKELIASVNIESKHNYLLNPLEFKFKLRELGEKNFSSILLLPEQVSFQSVESYKYGLMTSYLGRILKNKVTSELNVIYGKGKFALDAVKALSFYETTYNDEIKKYIDKLMLEISELEKEQQENIYN